MEYCRNSVQTLRRMASLLICCLFGVLMYNSDRILTGPCIAGIRSVYRVPYIWKAIFYQDGFSDFSDQSEKCLVLLKVTAILQRN